MTAQLVRFLRKTHVFSILALMLFSVSQLVLAAPSETGDRCFDGRDNDRDGLIDADDPDCDVPILGETWVVIDSDTPPKEIGAVMGVTWPAIDIVFELDGRPTSARVTKDGFYFDSSYYNISDCSNAITFEYVPGSVSNHELMIEHVYIHPDPNTGAMSLWIRNTNYDPFVSTIYGRITAESFGECTAVSGTNPYVQGIERVRAVPFGNYDLHEIYPPPYSLVKR